MTCINKFVPLLLVYSMFLLQVCFVLVFVDLTLLVLFFSVFKTSKTHKN